MLREGNGQQDRFFGRALLMRVDLAVVLVRHDRRNSSRACLLRVMGIR
jgi:hypothetical protein